MLSSGAQLREGSLTTLMAEVREERNTVAPVVCVTGAAPLNTFERGLSVIEALRSQAEPAAGEQAAVGGAVASVHCCREARASGGETDGSGLRKDGARAGEALLENACSARGEK